MHNSRNAMYSKTAKKYRPNT